MFLDLEGPGAHMHVGGVLLIQGRPPRREELVAHVASRLDRVPRYRQRLALVPFHLGRPVWVDDPKIDLAYHVTRAELPAPGDAGLKALAARFLGEPLDRSRPLWRMALVDGLGEDRFAILSKTHHCLLDGIGGIDFLAAITDGEPGSPPAAAGPVWRPRPAPGAVERLAAALGDALLRPLRLVRDGLTPGTDGRRKLLELVRGARPLAELALSWPAPRSPLDRRVGPARAWETLSLDLPTVKEVRAALGGTVNDVLLAVIAGALRALLGARGERIPDELRAFVPVNIRPASARGTYGNQVSLFLCPLPVGEPEAVERLRRISAATRRLKERQQAAGVVAFQRLGELVPAVVAAEAMHVVLAMHFFNLVVSNVPGPAEPRYLLGKRLVACHPAIPLAAGQSLSVGLLSCGPKIDVGLLAGAERAGELPALARAMSDELAALRAEAGRARAAPPVPSAAALASATRAVASPRVTLGP
jgi:WS/DGAT/MGAT family acyltransferase